MHSPVDPHDPEHDLDRLDNLTLLAVGEQADPDFVRHQAECSRCQAELAELTGTVRLARAAVRDVAAAKPPPRLWDAIAAEIAEPDRPPVASVAEERSRRAPRVSWRVVLVAAAVVAAASVGGYALGNHTSTPGSTVAASARLQRQPAGPVNVSGAATVIRSADGFRLDVRTQSLPYRNGYYAVWVYDPGINHMINVGVLNAKGQGSFALPQGVDIRDYDVVDVSAQNFDGNPGHEKSVLQGGLTQ